MTLSWVWMLHLFLRNSRWWEESFHYRGQREESWGRSNASQCIGWCRKRQAPLSTRHGWRRRRRRSRRRRRRGLWLIPRLVCNATLFMPSLFAAHTLHTLSVLINSKIKTIATTYSSPHASGHGLKMRVWLIPKSTFTTYSHPSPSCPKGLHHIMCWVVNHRFLEWNRAEKCDHKDA